MKPRIGSVLACKDVVMGPPTLRLIAQTLRWRGHGRIYSRKWGEGDFGAPWPERPEMPPGGADSQ